MQYDRSVSRGVRLTQIQHFLHKNSSGLTTHELARLCSVGIRTIQRDIQLLESDLGVPLLKKGNDRFSIEQSCYLLPPASLSLYEAVLLFLASRLIMRQTDEYNPHLQTALTKVASLLPAPLSAQLKDTATLVSHNAIKPKGTEIFEQVAIAWATQRRIKIVYRSLRRDKAKEWIVDPYFIEMTGVGFSTYVIGDATSTDRQGITTFKLARIEDIELLGENFQIPEDFRLTELLASSWGVIWGEDTVVKLRFSPNVTRRVKESVWHPSQKIEALSDGGCILTMRVGSVLEITPWIRGWGPDVEVLEPAVLRKDFQLWAEKMHNIYKSTQV